MYRIILKNTRTLFFTQPTHLKQQQKWFSSLDLLTPSATEHFYNPPEFSVIVVKKRKQDGDLCKKCVEVGNKIVEDGLEKFIVHTAIADFTVSSSEGLDLARKYKVSSAPFFLIRTKDDEARGQEWKLVCSYLELKQILLNKRSFSARE